MIKRILGVLFIIILYCGLFWILPTIMDNLTSVILVIHAITMAFVLSALFAFGVTKIMLDGNK